MELFLELYNARFNFGVTVFAYQNTFLSFLKNAVP